MSGRYHGQPMVAHLPLPIDAPHFDRWLEIFVETARDVCPVPAAAHFLERAHPIAESLELGIAAPKGRDQAEASATGEDLAAGPRCERRRMGGKSAVGLPKRVATS